MNDNFKYFKSSPYDKYAGLSVKKLIKEYKNGTDDDRDKILDYVQNSGRKSNLFKAQFSAALRLEPIKEGRYKGCYLGREALPPEFRRECKKDLESKTEE